MTILHTYQPVEPKLTNHQRNSAEITRIIQKTQKDRRNPFHKQMNTYRLIDKHEAERLTGLDETTLKKYRLLPNSPLIDGVHYERINSRVVRYRSPLIEHWAEYRHKPSIHNREIERYLAHLSQIS